MGTNLVAEVTAAMTDYCEDVQNAVNAAANEAAQLTKAQLTSNSPKRASGRGSGKYARGWRVKKNGTGHLVSYVVYNGSSPGLTHVLEHGHLARNQFGTFGRVRAIPHIGPAAEAGIQRFERSVRARLRRG